ncbi:MAG TPA: hypothetical protein VGI99_05685 [Gemmataceae bacterium]
MRQLDQLPKGQGGRKPPANRVARKRDRTNHFAGMAPDAIDDFTRWCSRWSASGRSVEEIATATGLTTIQVQAAIRRGHKKGLLRGFVEAEKRERVRAERRDGLPKDVRRVKGGSYQARPWIGPGRAANVNLGLFHPEEWGNDRDAAANAAAYASREFKKRLARPGADLLDVLRELQGELRFGLPVVPPHVLPPRIKRLTRRTKVVKWIDGPPSPAWRPAGKSARRPDRLVEDVIETLGYSVIDLPGQVFPTVEAAWAAARPFFFGLGGPGRWPSTKTAAA